MDVPVPIGGSPVHFSHDTVLCGFISGKTFPQSVICSKDVAGILKEDARKGVFPSRNVSRKAGSDGRQQ